MSTKIESFGKYILLEKLATGGMAEVFLARGSGAGGIAKFFAIKRILPQFSDSPEFIDMFKEEAKIAINLSHSNIVSIHEFDIRNDQFFLVMDYVEGRNLRQILNKMKKSGVQFSIDQIVFIIREVSAGLDHAHRCLDGGTGKPLNITHRDMSPQNVMVSFDGEVKVVDFGIAKAESQIENTRAGTLKGKFGYMSPEQAEGQAVDLRTDIFSLGIVLWELLANDRLFVANNEINTLRKIRDCQIPSLKKINPNIHSELERIVMKALTRDRNLRYQTCAALHRDLNRFLNRQYPDFASQDFSVFIKSVFADEILSTRKRLVEFSKLNVDSSRELSSNRPLNATDTADISKSWVDKSNRIHHADAQTSSLIANAATPTPSIANSRTSQPPHQQPSEITKTFIPNDELRMADPVHAEPIQTKSAQINSVNTEDVPVLHEAKIDITSTSIQRTNHGFTRSAKTLSSKPTFSSARLIIVLLSLFGLYIGLVKTLPTQMSPVIAVTDQFMQPLHQAIGLQRTTDSASNSVNPMPVQPTAIPTGIHTVRPDTEVLRPPTQSPELAQTTGSVVVTSDPSGGEIFIDGKKSGYITPSRVQVPQDRPFHLSIKKKGYFDYVRAKVKRDELGSKLNANLVKSSMAYLDIDIIPPRNATIYLNGIAITGESLPIRNLAVTAGVQLKLRAESTDQGISDEVIVNVPENNRRHIQLLLKKR